MNWFLCTLFGHDKVPNPQTQHVTEPGPCAFAVKYTCARRGCKWEMTSWAKGTLA